jgi:hypothetical protein
MRFAAGILCCWAATATATAADNPPSCPYTDPQMCSPAWYEAWRNNPDCRITSQPYLDAFCAQAADDRISWLFQKRTGLPDPGPVLLEIVWRKYPECRRSTYPFVDDEKCAETASMREFMDHAREEDYRKYPQCRITVYPYLDNGCLEKIEGPAR